MKEQYIKQVEKELSLPRKMKKEVVRDLNEVFASAMEHGETEQQIIQRLGTPKEFADSTAEQFGIDNTKSKKRNGIISTLAALVIAAAAFSVYAVTQSGKVPEGAIGQADATTNIQIEGAFAFDISQILLAIGFAATAIALLLIIRTIHKNRRSPMKKYISVFTIMIMIFLAACSNQNTSSTPTSNENNTQSNSVTKLDEGVWPENEYTEGLPVAPGTVAWATLDTEHENCNINLTGISENDYNEYMELLNQEGFSVIENVSEEIEGENYVSIGTLLSNDKKWLSISYIPDSLTIYISFDNN